LLYQSRHGKNNGEHMGRPTSRRSDGAAQLRRDREAGSHREVCHNEGRSGDATLLLAQRPGAADRSREVAGERQTSAAQASQEEARKGFDAGISQVINLTCPRGYQVVIFRDASIAVSRAGVLAAHSVPPARPGGAAVGLSPIPLRSITRAGGA